jgi:hypothetical protein
MEMDHRSNQERINQLQTAGGQVSPGQARYPGLACCAAAAVLAALAFVALPYASLGPWSVTAPQAIALNAQFGQTGWEAVWLILIGELVVAAVAAVHWVSRGRSAIVRALCQTCGLASSVIASLYGINIPVLAANEGVSVDAAMGILGSGFWVGLCAMAVAALSALIECGKLSR